MLNKFIIEIAKKINSKIYEELQKHFENDVLDLIRYPLDGN